jgi:hypothetical protein
MPAIDSFHISNLVLTLLGLGNALGVFSLEDSIEVKLMT